MSQSSHRSFFLFKSHLPQPKLDKSDLHRRPEFEETKPDIKSLNQALASGASVPSAAGPSRPAMKPEPVAHAMLPPQNIPPRMPQFSPNATSTPTAKGKAPAHPNGLQTPIQTPIGARLMPGQNEGGMAQRTAERHAARLKAIQEAQEAQRREEAAASASAVASAPATSDRPALPSRDLGAHPPVGPTVAPAAAQPPAAPPPQEEAVETTPLDDSDEFHFASDDDAFFANVDLSALEEGMGRPIDFEEGKGGTEVEEDAPDSFANKHPPSPNTTAARTSGVQTGAPRTAAAPMPLPQAQRSEPQGKPSAPAPSAATAGGSHQRPQPSRHPHNPDPNPHTHVPPTSAKSNPPSSSAERPRTPSMGGGFSFPAVVNL